MSSRGEPVPTLSPLGRPARPTQPPPRRPFCDPWGQARPRALAEPQCRVRWPGPHLGDGDMSFWPAGVWGRIGGVAVGVGEGRPSASCPLCLRSPHTLQGSALSFPAAQGLFLPARSAEASQPLHLELTRKEWGPSLTGMAGQQPWPCQGGRRPPGLRCHWCRRGPILPGQPSQVHAPEGSSELAVGQEDFTAAGLSLACFGRGHS